MATNPSKIVSKSRAKKIVQAPTLKKSTAPSQLTIEGLLTETQQYLAPSDLEPIRHAYDLANQAHAGTIRRSGEAYIQHPLEVAYLLAGMRIDAEGIMAALLHDVVEDTDYALDDLREQFGADVATIVDGVTKFDALAGKQPDKNAHEGTGSGEDAAEDAQLNRPLTLADKRRQ